MNGWDLASNTVTFALTVWVGLYLRREWRAWRHHRAAQNIKVTEDDLHPIYRHLQDTYDRAMRLRERLADEFNIHINPDDPKWPATVADLRAGRRWTLIGIDRGTGERVHTHMQIRDGVLCLESD